MDTISGILTTLFVDSKKKFDENNDKNSNEINFSDIFTNYETKEENIEENKEKNDMKTLEKAWQMPNFDLTISGVYKPTEKFN